MDNNYINSLIYKNSNNLEKLKKYLDAGNSPIIYIKDDISFFHLAIFENKINIVKLLLDYNISLDFVNDNTQSFGPALLLASGVCNYEIVYMLLLYGANPNVVRLDKMDTPLIIAAYNASNNIYNNDDCIKIIKLLLDAGGDPFIKDNKNLNLFDMPDIIKNIKNIINEYINISNKKKILLFLSGINDTNSSLSHLDTIDTISNMNIKYYPKVKEKEWLKKIQNNNISKFVNDINLYGGKKNNKTINKYNK